MVPTALASSTGIEEFHCEVLLRAINFHVDRDCRMAPRMNCRHILQAERGEEASTVYLAGSEDSLHIPRRNPHFRGMQEDGVVGAYGTGSLAPV
jgi:hypothetical protein